MPKPSESDKVLLKLERYCAWQERCEAEVRTKMRALEIPASKQNSLIEHLREDGYLDDARYAKSFAGGKFRMKKWGRIKIAYAMNTKDIPDKLIDAAVNAFDPDEYEKVLREMLKEKRRSLSAIKDPYQLNHKLSLYAIAKGFEPDLVWDILKGIK